MKSIGLSAARDGLSALVNEVAHGKTPVILESHGRAKAALICLEDLNRLEKLGGEGSMEGEMLSWLADTEKLLEAEASGGATLSALDEVRGERVAENAGLYRRQRRPKAGRRRGR